MNSHKKNLLLASVLLLLSLGGWSQVAATKDSLSNIKPESAAPVRIEELSLKAGDIRSLHSLSDEQLNAFVKILDASPTLQWCPSDYV